MSRTYGTGSLILKHDAIHYCRVLGGAVALFGSSSMAAVGLFFTIRFGTGGMPGTAEKWQLAAIGISLGTVYAGLQAGSTLWNAPVWKRMTQILAVLGCTLIAIPLACCASSPMGVLTLLGLLILPLLSICIYRTVPTWVSKQDFVRLLNSPAINDKIEQNSNALCELDPSIDQMIVRRRVDDGSDEIEAKIRGRFAAGERTKHMHLGLCPPLPHVPELQCEQSEGPEADVTIAQCLPAGIRIDVRLRQTATCSVDVVVDLFAKSSHA